MKDCGSLDEGSIPSAPKFFFFDSTLKQSKYQNKNFRKIVLITKRKVERENKTMRERLKRIEEGKCIPLTLVWVVHLNTIRPIQK